MPQKYQIVSLEKDITFHTVAPKCKFGLFSRLNLGLVCLIFIGLLKLEIASMGRDH